ncbi:MAG: GNAT family N-acetyltransferase [Planctomycetota bacterium]|jgi:putative acetyltransferase
MTIQLRSEKPGEEAAIDEVNCRAFRSMDEAHIVRLMRAYSPHFDPRYSITAWDGDTMVGHALFTPARVRFMGETVPGLSLGPIAVIPEMQKRGIGGELLAFGHAMGREDGFAFAFLNGHPSYYPRYGYIACFGFARVSIDREKLPKTTRQFRRMPVRTTDLHWLVERYAAEWDDVDFAWVWGPHLSEWTFPPMNAVMWWTEEGRRAAYTVDKPGMEKCQLLLAEDPALAREVIGAIRPATLEHHPSGWLAKNALDPAWADPKVKQGEAAMAYPLRKGVLDPCINAQEKGERLPGFCLFPLPFLAC